MELIAEVVKELEVLQDGFVVYDAILGSECFVVVSLLMVKGDNPMLSQISSHIGITNSKFGCRKCEVQTKIDSLEMLKKLSLIMRKNS